MVVAQMSVIARLPLQYAHLNMLEGQVAQWLVRQLSVSASISRRIHLGIVEGPPFLLNRTLSTLGVLA